MSLLSIDIGTNSIAIVQGSVKGNMIEVEAAEKVMMKPGTIADSVIKNQGEVVAALNSLLGRRDFKAKQTIVTINDGNALIREFTIPTGNQRQMDAMVKSEMVNAYSAQPSDIIEYKILENKVDDSGAKFLRIRAMALNAEIVESYHNVILSARLRPLAMDFHINSIEKLLHQRPQINGMDLTEKSFLLLDFGFSGTMTFMIYDYQLIASRFIPIGLSDFEPAINSGRFGFKEADDSIIDFKEQLDFRHGSVADPMVMRSAEEILIQCCTEIQKLVIYSTARLPQNFLSCGFLIGGGSEIQGIDSFISSELNTSIKPLSSLSGIHFLNIMDEKDLLFYLNAIGALIRLK